ncbi:MAG: response regulator [Chloroflexaceae bacterium]|nr:response regulator [Chloroflexaceae bacterium]
MATILIIDDDVAQLASMGTQLEGAGYNVLKTSEATPAEVIFDEYHPDLVVLEVKTSRDAGWRLLERFASQSPVIVVSAYSREEDVVRGLEAGAADYLAKPYRSAELFARIRRHITQRLYQDTEHDHTEHNGHSSVAQMPVNTSYTASPALEQAETAYQPVAVEPVSSPKAVSPSQKPLRANSGHATEPEAVFMDEQEEIALLRSSQDTVPVAAEALPEDTSLGARLRAERQRRRITLVQAENDLHIRMWYLQAMEEERFAMLPIGPMASQMLRSYATYLQMDVNAVMEEHNRLYKARQAGSPPRLEVGFPPSRKRSLPRWMFWTVAVILGILVSVVGIVLLDPEGAQTLNNQLLNLINMPSPTPDSSSLADPPGVTALVEHAIAGISLLTRL